MTTVTDGSRDFDWEKGTWDTAVRVLHSPLSSAASWHEYVGTSIVHALCGGDANVVELDVAGGAGRIRGVSLRLFNAGAQQWSLNFAGMGDGLLTPPVIGGFAGGRGEFHGTDTVDGRVVLVRFAILDVTVDSARFEQSYSLDGGRSWTLTWVALDTRRPVRHPRGTDPPLYQDADPASPARYGLTDA